jgi:hypothetical protein
VSGNAIWQNQNTGHCFLKPLWNVCIPIHLKRLGQSCIVSTIDNLYKSNELSFIIINISFYINLSPIWNNWEASVTTPGASYYNTDSTMKTEMNTSLIWHWNHHLVFLDLILSCNFQFQSSQANNFSVKCPFKIFLSCVFKFTVLQRNFKWWCYCSSVWTYHQPSDKIQNV